MASARTGAARVVALVGPQGSGKTTLLESLLAVAGAIPRKGRVADGTTIGDSSAEARARLMSTELNIASLVAQGDPWTFLDCPGAVELAQDARQALMVADAAIVVVEPEPSRALAMAPLLRFLDEREIPHLLFINKIDGAPSRVRDVLQALQVHSARPLVLRQIPLREGETISGYVDLVSERAYHYEPGKPSALVQIPDDVADREADERQRLVETLADFDDALMEQLLEDVIPPKAEIYAQLRKDLAADRIVPVLIGAAEHDYGVRRLLKALRHEVPPPELGAARLGLPEQSPMAQVFRIANGAHAGRLALCRVWSGRLTDGMTLGGGRVGGLLRLTGATQAKVSAAEAGEVVALVRLEGVMPGDLLMAEGVAPAPSWPEPIAPLHAVAIAARERKDEVKLGAALKRLVEEDPSLILAQDAEGHEIVLAGQGDVHVQLALERLRRRHEISVVSRPPHVAYRETIRRGTTRHARFKRQSGGHGQFADIHIDVSPMAPGAGHHFANAVVGGAVPKQYVPGVEAGVRDALMRGPLGFPVVDVGVTLTDGQYHSVDSSEQAFRTAARQGMAEALADCEPVLLEPIEEVTVAVPSEHTARVQRLLSSRRGQILGFDARDGWPGWDEVRAMVPASDLHDLVTELRSLTLGVGSFSRRFSHYAELSGKAAQKVIDARREAAAPVHT
jgi:elongation factor G